MLDYVGEYEGTKEKISKAFKIKEHFVVRMITALLVLLCMLSCCQPYIAEVLKIILKSFARSVHVANVDCY